MTLDWINASESLPGERELVLLYLPDYQLARPRLARLIKGDPEAQGTYYQRDRWLLIEWAGNHPPVQPRHRWARIPAPDGVTWATRPKAWMETEQTPEQEPGAPTGLLQPQLFGGQP